MDKKPKRYRLEVPDLPQDEQHAGGVAVTASMNAAAVMEPLQKNLMGGKATFGGLLAGTNEEIERVQAGDLTGIEAMLIGQALSLQTMYASLTRKAVNQDYLANYQAHMNLALKAQAQSRATLQTLIELKHPRNPPTFIKQANVSHGPQQVNNGIPSPAQESPEAPSKLLEAEPSPVLDAPTKQPITQEKKQ